MLETVLIQLINGQWQLCDAVRLSKYYTKVVHDILNRSTGNITLMLSIIYLLIDYLASI